MDSSGPAPSVHSVHLLLAGAIVLFLVGLVSGHRTLA
jgi:hypothetical protein